MDDLLKWAQEEGNCCTSKDWPAVLEKLKKLQLDRTHIVADFDMTLTQYWNPKTGKRSLSSHGALDKWQGLPAEIKKRLDSLYNTYYPMEISTDLGYDEKFAAMVQWWTRAHEAIIELKMTRLDVQQMVQQSDEEYVFRSKLREFVDLVTKLEVPLLVFSAGLGDVIHELMQNHNLWTKDMALVSNVMIFDEKDVCIGFSEPLIHTLNKNEACLANDLHAAKIDNRESVILMGDSIGDLKMADGIKHDVKLTIGFCNHNLENLLPLYRDAFDIVLTHDTSLEFVIRLFTVLAMRQYQ